MAGSRRHRGDRRAGRSAAAGGRGRGRGEGRGGGGLHSTLSDPPTGRLAKQRLDLGEFIFHFLHGIMANHFNPRKKTKDGSI